MAELVSLQSLAASPPVVVPPFVPLAVLASTSAPSAGWVWEGFLAAGKVTLPPRLTRREIWMRWPIVEVRPDESTLWRWLELAVVEGAGCSATAGSAVCRTRHFRC